MAKVIKSYEGFPSRTRVFEGTIEECRNYISYSVKCWNGYKEISEDKSSATLDEGDGSPIITLEIIED